MTPDDRYYIEGPVPETPGPQVWTDRPAEPWTKTTIVGTKMPRPDGYDRTSGSATYTTDVVLPDMLFGAILVCPHAHARARRIDTSKAAAMPGVRAILTPDTPSANLPWYGGRGRLLSSLCRFHGEEVVAVAAETPYQAWDAVRAVTIDWEVLPHISVEEDALKPGAPLLHEGTKSNQAGDTSRYARGDVDAGFKQADVIVEQVFTTACEFHVPTEPHATVAKWESGRLTVWESTQGVYPIQSGLAQALKIPLANVRVIGPFMGGGFGSKLGLNKQTVLAALLAKQTARPVKLALPREHMFLNVGNRPPDRMACRAGAKKDGTLIAFEMKTTGTGGAYQGGGNPDYVVRELYKCPNVRTEVTDVFINAGVQRAFRAPGHPQGAWALEQTMDMLAEKLGMDPVEFRLKNLTPTSQTRKDIPYTSTGFGDCLREGAREFGWAEARKRGPGAGPIRRGVGIAGGMWQGGNGGPPATILVKVFADGSVNVNMGASDNGCGTRAVMAMIVAEELGVPLDRISVEHADTGTTQYATASGGSKTIPTESPTARAAALDAKRQIIELAAEELKVPAEQLAMKGGEVVVTADPAKKLALSGIRGLGRRGLVVGIGYRGPNPSGKAINPFAAHFCEVEVNTRTGEVTIVRYLAAQDSGRVMNRLSYDNQVIGGVTMGIGLAMTEERILDRHQTGRVVNMNWHDYKVPTAMDVPADLVPMPIDPGDTECNITGCKGLGEPATVPAAAAVANAIYNAVGVRPADSPASPRRLGQLLADRQKVLKGQKRG